MRRIISKSILVSIIASSYDGDGTSNFSECNDRSYCEPYQLGMVIADAKATAIVCYGCHSMNIAAAKTALASLLSLLTDSRGTARRLVSSPQRDF